MTHLRQPRTAGHTQGMEAVRRIVDAAPAFGIGTLTFFGFASANWRRPRPAIDHSIELLCDYLERKLAAQRPANTQ